MSPWPRLLAVVCCQCCQCCQCCSCGSCPLDSGILPQGSRPPSLQRCLLDFALPVPHC
jgi:hypothetical protein